MSTYCGIEGGSSLSAGGKGAEDDVADSAANEEGESCGEDGRTGSLEKSVIKTFEN